MENGMRSLSMPMAAVAAACLATIATAARAQTFDGSYAGSMALTAERQTNAESYHACVQTRPVSMQIVRGAVYLAYADWHQHIIHYRGWVGANGAVQAWHTNGDGTKSILTGQVQQGMFTGDLNRDNYRCPYSVVMSAGAPAR
jgi:hypothetical protein